MPGLSVVRPCDANETAVAWRTALSSSRPVGLALTRQNVPTLDRSVMASADGLERGGYVLAEATGGSPEVILMGTGSEIQLAVGARERLEADGIPTRVVSMPCIEWFDEQDAAYRESVLPPSVRARVSVEAGVTMPWHRFVGDAGRCIGIEHFGASADAATLFREFGFTVDAVVAAAHESLTDTRA
jgi:transketolase